MFLRELRIQNLRSLKDVTLTFGAAEETRRWTLILGENGCGKSTILRAAALVLAGRDALPSLLGDIDSWVRFGSDKATISAVIVTAEGDRREIQLVIPRKLGLSRLLELNRQSLGPLDDAIVHTARSYLTVGYGASRRLNSDAESAFKSQRRAPRARAVATLFSADETLDPLEAWVIDMDYSGRIDAASMVKRIAKELMPHVEFEGIDKPSKQLLFRTPDGVTPLSRLSDGYQNVAAWCGDLLRSVTTIFEDYQDPLSARGLLLVDEIDLHLHPVWQRRLRSFVETTFPNLQIMATTHSALTVQQAGEHELHIVRRVKPKSSPIVEVFEGAPNRMMLHQLLLSPLFALESMDSVEVETERKRYRTLKAKPTRSAGEERQLASLKESISDLPDLAQGISKHEAKQVAVLADIRAALDSKTRLTKPKSPPPTKRKRTAASPPRSRSRRR